MENQYAVWKKPDGSFFYNPNCYFDVNKVGDIVNGIECIKVCSLKEAEEFVAENNPPAGDIFADLIHA